MSLARLLSLACAAALAAPPGPPLLSLSLSQAEEQALRHSPVLAQARSSLAAAQAQVEAQLAPLLPRVTLDGAVQYQTQVPKFSLSPTAPALQFGAHESYSVGPSLSYTLWDQGGLLAAWRSQKALARSQQAQLDLLARQVRLVTRLDYFQVQLALEQERSLTDFLRLAEAQFRDIDSRYRAGASNRVDWLSAHEQVIDRRRDLRSAEADVATALRALFAQTGQGQELDLSAPVDARIEQPTPGLSTPTVTVALQPLESVETALAPAADAPVDGAHPQLLVYENQSKAQALSAKSVAAGEWPRLQLSFKSDYQYPNMPLLESVWQNTVGMTASVPLFEGGRTRQQARAQRELARGALSQEDQARDELLRDWHKARDQYAALRDEEALDRQSIDETAEIARLRYSAYRNGGATILDVETANVNAVEARVIAARRRTQVLIQLATLESLSAVKENR